MSYYMEVSSCPTLPLSWVPNCPVPNCPVSKCPVPSCPVSSCPGFVLKRDKMVQCLLTCTCTYVLFDY